MYVKFGDYQTDNTSLVTTGAVPCERSTRLAYVEITPEILLDLLKVPPEGRVVDGMLVKAVGDAIPMSAKALRCGIDHSGNVRLMIEDESLPELQSGEMFPRINTVYQISKPDPML